MFNKDDAVRDKILNGMPVLLVATMKPETDESLLEFRLLGRKLSALSNLISCNQVLGGSENKVEYRIRVPAILSNPDLSRSIVGELTAYSQLLVEKTVT